MLPRREREEGLWRCQSTLRSDNLQLIHPLKPEPSNRAVHLAELLPAVIFRVQVFSLLPTVQPGAGQ